MGIKNLNGQNFGKLLVIKDSGKRTKSGNVIWECLCECGNICYVKGPHLQSGHTQSCGCYRYEQVSNASRKDIAGKRYGKLIALEPTEKRAASRSIIWKCSCDCGNISYASLNSLESGKTRSCGCSRAEQQSFGESFIEKVLKSNNISFRREYRFNDCVNPKTGQKLRFDFYLPDYNCCIEYDGEQHFKETTMCQDSLEDRKYRDEIKNNYCIVNNIKIIRIPYWDIDKIDKDYIIHLIQDCD